MRFQLNAIRNVVFSIEKGLKWSITPHHIPTTQKNTPGTVSHPPLEGGFPPTPY